MNKNDPGRCLGTPIPNTCPHAVSVSMPEWRDVVGYEENEARVHNALQNGYPRFFLHRFVAELRQRYQPLAKPGETVWIFPSLEAAEGCIAFTKAGRTESTKDGVALAFLPAEKECEAKTFWQHSGLIISSRQARNILDGKPPMPPTAYQPLKQLVAKYHNLNAEDVYLFPSGMGAIFTAYKALTQDCKKTIQLGFPYLDILKIQQKFGDGIYLCYDTPDDLKTLEAELKKGKCAAIFCEIPGNPLLRTIDLKRLQALLQPLNIPLVIDDTVGTAIDIDIKPYADVIVTSLTKFFCGKGNVVGGSVTLNPSSPHYTTLKKKFSQTEELLYSDDAHQLLESGQGFATRMKTISANAEKLAAFLAAHPAVGEVYYPKGDPCYETIRKPQGGYGGLLSFVMKNKEAACGVYDRLQTDKGPSLGTEFTLVCPYTLLAHYNELNWAEENGIPRHLLRVSVGIENSDEIIQHFADALQTSYP